MAYYDLRCDKCEVTTEYNCTFAEIALQRCPTCGLPLAQDYSNKRIESGIARTVGTFAEQHTRQTLGGSTW